MRTAWYWTGIIWTDGRIGGFAVSWVIVCWRACCAAAGAWAEIRIDWAGVRGVHGPASCAGHGDIGGG